MAWKTIGTHLITNIPKIPESKKIAGFDLDGTLINTKSGLKFARSSSDWQLWKSKHHSDSPVIPKIKELIDSGYIIVIFTNQGGVSLGTPNSKSYTNFKDRLDQFVRAVGESVPNFSPVIIASPKKPGGKVKRSSDELHLVMRKPQIGMWKYLLKHTGDVDLEQSFFVGDAAGRKGDFSNSDLKFAESVGVGFKTPEEFFS